MSVVAQQPESAWLPSVRLDYPIQMTEPKSIPFSAIGDPLNLLLTELGHKLSREWPTKYAQVTSPRELFVVDATKMDARIKKVVSRMTVLKPPRGLMDVTQKGRYPKCKVAAL